MKRFFSKNLFLEGLRQLKVLGIISAVISTLISFFTVYGYYIAGKSVYINTEVGKVPYESAVGAEICAPVALVGWIVVPLAMFMLFSFMNKRNSSDFYHGIVQRRESLCLSFVTSILAMALMVMASSILVGVLSVLVFPHVVFADYFASDLLEMFLKSLAVGIFWIGVLLVSMSLSGTLLTNFAVTSIILLFPKIVYLVVNIVVVEDIDIYPFSYGESIFSGKYNLVTGFINRLFGGYRYIDNSLYSILYTAGLGLVFILCGCVIFCLRKSEAATLAAPTRKLQMVFRVIPAFVITMVPSVFIYQMILDDRHMGDDDFFTILVFYVMAVVAYFLYEIITTKKWRNIWKSAPGLLLILLLDVVLVGTMLGRREMILAEQPKNSSYVRILGSRMSDMDSTDYFLVHAAEVKITDEQAIRILEENLSQNVDLIRSGEDYLSNNRVRYLVEFRDNGKSTYRLVFVNNSQSGYLDRVVGNTKTMDALTDLLNEKVYDIQFGDLQPESEERKQQLLREYIEEVERNPEQYAEILLGRNYYDGTSKHLEQISLRTYYNNRMCYVSLPIYYTMDFAETYVQEYNREAALQEREGGIYEESLLNPGSGGDIYIYVYEPTYGNNGVQSGFSRSRYATVDGYSYASDSQGRQAYDMAIRYLKSQEGGRIITENGFAFVMAANDGNLNGRYYPLTPYGIEILRELWQFY